MSGQGTPFFPGLERMLKIQAKRLVIHSDGTLSVKVYRKGRSRPWRWEHACIDIQQRDFKRLEPEDQARIRKLEQKKGRELVVPDYEY